MPTPLVVDSTVPVDAGPLSETFSRNWLSVKVTGTVVPLALTVTMHVPEPAQGAPHVKVEPISGLAVSMTWVPWATDAEQALPQDRVPPPAHVAETVPVPLPLFATTRLALASAKVAMTVVAVVTFERVHAVPFVLEHPDHDLNAEPLDGAACKLRLDPAGTVTMHELIVQLMPVPVTVPLPAR